VVAAIAILAFLGAGCSTVQNLGTEPFGACHQRPGVIYGGLRSDVATFANYPIGPISFWVAICAVDVVGDTITLPYILARQGYEWAREKWPKPSSEPLPSGDQASDGQTTSPTSTTTFSNP
jgi:hypothetical protein